MACGNAGGVALAVQVLTLTDLEERQFLSRSSDGHGGSANGPSDVLTVDRGGRKRSLRSRGGARVQQLWEGSSRAYFLIFS